jgi:hypothetical protein
MAKRIKEQLDYGNRPERMDPNLERKLASPEGLYAQNPAMKNKEGDVQRLISNRFQKVAEKLSDVTGIQNLSSQQTQGMIYQEMMRKLPNIMRIEAAHRDELEQLAIEAALEESEVPVDWYKIEAYLNREPIDTSNFRMKPEEEKDDEEEEGEEEMEIPSFDVEDLTKDEIFELEKHKRNIINAIIQGAAKKGHYIFQKPDIKARLDEIDPSLYRDYLGIMAINDFLYFSMEQMIEMMSQTGQGIAGKVELDDNDEEGDEGEEGEETPDTVIKAFGLIFPILCHEIIKGLEEAKGRHGLPKDPEMAQRVMGQTDTLSNEPMQLRIGPEIVERIRFALPDKMYEPENKGLINWFHTLLYQIEAQEFLEIIGNAISEDSSKVAKATSKFNEIMREAIKMKEEFEDYKEEEGIDSDENEDDGLDDFLGSLGISRPK